MKGEGQYAELLRKRFEIACKRLGLNAGGRKRLTARNSAAGSSAGEVVLTIIRLLQRFLMYIMKTLTLAILIAAWPAFAGAQA